MLNEQNNILNRLTLCLIELIKELEALNLGSSLSDEKLNVLIDKAVQKAKLGLSETRANELIQNALNTFNVGVDENLINQKIKEALQGLKLGLSQSEVDAKIEQAKALIQARINEIVLRQGEQGLQGERGEQGIQGLQGEKGEKGEKGDKGEKGEKGERGERGANGQDGIDGQNGRDGANGKSAFELWLLKPENTGKSEEDFFKALSVIKNETNYNHIKVQITGGAQGVRTNAAPPQNDIGLPLGYVWVDERVYPYSFYVLKDLNPLTWKLVDLGYPKKLKSFDLVLNRKDKPIDYYALTISNIILVKNDDSECKIKDDNTLIYEDLNGVSLSLRSNLKAYLDANPLVAGTYSLPQALSGSGAFLSAVTKENTDYTLSFTLSQAVQVKGVKLNAFGNVSTRDWCPSTKIILKDENDNIIAQKLFEFNTNAEATSKGFISCNVYGKEL